MQRRVIQPVVFTSEMAAEAASRIVAVPKQHTTHIEGVQLTDAQVVELIGELAWPCVVLIALGIFSKPLYDLVAHAQTLSIGKDGVLVKRQQTVTAALSAAVATSDTQALSVSAISAEVKSIVTDDAVKELAGTRLLWVDDTPKNNSYLVQAFEGMGVTVDIALDTDAALNLIAKTTYGAIISDMGRPSGPRAGYTLLDSLRAQGNKTPYLIYAGSSSPDHRAEAVQHGAIGSTNQPQEVFRVITDVLRAGKH